MLNRTLFFDAIRKRPFAGFLQTLEVDGITRILDEWDKRALTDLRHLAYILATVYHETGQAMQPIKEGGSATYLQSKPYYPWYGRGLVQITWQENYAKFGITRADDALSWPTALHVLFDGMMLGVFTGKKLADFFSATQDDPIGARRIINGTDKASLIAGYHNAFLAALESADIPPSIVTQNAPPHILPAPPPAPSLWSRFTSLFTGKAA